MGRVVANLAVADRAGWVYGCIGAPFPTPDTAGPFNGAGDELRPSVVFLGLFLVLMLVYRGLADVVGSGATFAIQAVLVVALVAGLTWYRRHQGAALDPRAGSRDEAPDEASSSPRRNAEDPAPENEEGHFGAD